MQDEKSPPDQTSHVIGVNSSNWRSTAIAIVISALIAGINGYLLGASRNQSLPKISIQNLTQVSNTLTPTTAPPPTLHVIANNIPKTNPTSIVDLHQQWQTYTNHNIGVQFQYPDGWQVEIYDQKDNISCAGTGFVTDILIREHDDIKVRASVSCKLDVSTYVRNLYKDDKTVSIYNGTISTSPYIVTEYILTTDVNNLWC